MKLLIILLILLTIPPIPTDDVITPHHPTIPDAQLAQTFGHLNHVGIDYNVPVGSEVYADLDGIITKAIEDSRCYGRYIVILHEDGNASLYAHLSKSLVEKGDKVKSGDLIALSGGDERDNIDGDGCSIRAHLHWEVRVKDYLNNNLYNIDPIKYLLSYINYTPIPDWIQSYLNYEE